MKTNLTITINTNESALGVISYSRGTLESTGLENAMYVNAVNETFNNLYN